MSLLEKPLHPYFVRRFQLTVQSGYILNGLQVVIPLGPSSLRKVVVTELHETHTGIVKMKSVARMYVHVVAYKTLKIVLDNSIIVNALLERPSKSSKSSLGTAIGYMGVVTHRFRWAIQEQHVVNSG